MPIDTRETGVKSSGSKSTIGASLAALGGVVLASSCCLPMFPFLLAAGAAGSSAFFTRIRPFLLGASVLLIAFGFYQRWRAKRCNVRPSVFSAILLWCSAVVVVVSILFPQIIFDQLAAQRVVASPCHLDIQNYPYLLSFASAPTEWLSMPDLSALSGS